jgi:hypothetical protein
MIELSDELAAVEAHYADLLQELATLYQVREQLRRQLAGPGVARRGVAKLVKGGEATQGTRDGTAAGTGVASQGGYRRAALLMALPAPASDDTDADDEGDEDESQQARTIARLMATPAVKPRRRAKAPRKGGKPALQVLIGGEDAGFNPAQRLAQKQGTRALLRVVDEGYVAS